MTDSKDILARLDPATRKRIKMANEVALNRIPLASIGLTRALNGGIGTGRQTLVWGSKSSGKSSMLLETVGLAQKEGLTCAWIDAEQAFDPQWATRLGVNVDELMLSPTKTISGMTEIGTDLLKAGVDILVVDSISALLPQAYFEKDSEELKDLSGSNKIGSMSKDMSAALAMLNYANSQTALILISQVRNKIGTWGASMSPTGGYSVSFYSSTSIKLTSSATESNQIKDSIQSGNILIDAMVGRKIDWIIDFNKIGPPMQKGDYNFYYNGEHVGIDRMSEVFNMAVQTGVITKVGKAGYHFGDESSWHGKAKTVQALREDPELLARVVSQIA